MGVELFSENSSMAATTPRISFSYDLCQSDVNVAVDQQHHRHPLRSNSSSSLNEFDFCVRDQSFFEQQESSSADELFSGGKIVPTDQIKKKPAAAAQPKQLDQITPPHQPPLPPTNTSTTTTKESCKENKITSNDEKQSSKSFWRFKRSSSCGSGYGRTLCPLPLLSRSNSTGSASSSSSVKRAPGPLSKDGHQINHKQNSQKSGPNRKLYSSSQSSSSASMSHQKPPLKKSTHGVSINPVLNVPTTNLFGFGLIFSNAKDKSKKKVIH